MPKTTHTFEVTATADEIFSFLLDDTFAAQLEERLDKVSKVELIKAEPLEDGRIRRILRYTAPTELPRFLRRFQDKAPEEVQWDEVSVIDRDNHNLYFEIHPDVPETWHDYYKSSGQLRARSRSGGGCKITNSMEFSIDAPMGLGMVISRALKSELNNIFESTEELLKDRFGG